MFDFLDYKRVEDALLWTNSHQKQIFFIPIVFLILIAMFAFLYNLILNRNLKKKVVDATEAVLAGNQNELISISDDVYVKRIKDIVSENTASRITLKVEMIEYFYELIDSAQNKFASRLWVSSILPIALVFTFLLIAAALPGLAKTLTDLSGSAANTSNINLKDFADTLGTIGTKFLISVVGLLSSLIASWFISHSDGHTKDEIINRTKLLLAGTKKEIVTESELSLKNNAKMLELTTELASSAKETVKNTQKIENMVVRVDDFSDEVIRRLEGMVKSSLMERMTELSQQQTNELRNIANAVTDKFANTIENSMERLVNSLENNINLLSEKVAQQGEGQVDALLSKLESVVSGGMSTQTSDLKATLSEMKSTLPEIVLTLKNQIGEMGSQREIEFSRTSGMMDQMLKTAELQQLFIDQMKADVGKMRDDMTEFGKRLFEQQRESMEGFAQKYIKANIESALDQLESFEEQTIASEENRSKKWDEYFTSQMKSQRELTSEMRELVGQNTLMIETTQAMVDNLSSQTASTLSASLKPIMQDVSTIHDALRSAVKSISETLQAVDQREKVVQFSIRTVETSLQQLNGTTSKLEQVGRTFESSIKDVGKIVTDIPISAREISKSLREQSEQINEQKKNLEIYSTRMAEVLKEGSAKLFSSYSELSERSKQLGDHTLSRVDDSLNDLNENMQRLSKAIAESKLKA